MQAREDVGACEPLVGRVGGEELLDLLDGGTAAQTADHTDELDVAEVGGGQHVRLAPAEEAEALNRPWADVGHGEKALVAGGVAGVAATGGNGAGDGAQRHRAAVGEVQRLELGGRPPGDGAGARYVAQGIAAAAGARAPAGDDPALDLCGPHR